MAKNKSKFKVTGITAEGKYVLAGCYEFHQTEGLPLEILFNYLKERNYIPDWIDIYRSARSNGMSHERILAKLEPEIDDSFGPEWTKEVFKNLNLIFGEKNA